MVRKSSKHSTAVELPHFMVLSGHQSLCNAGCFNNSSRKGRSMVEADIAIVEVVTTSMSRDADRRRSVNLTALPLKTSKDLEL